MALYYNGVCQEENITLTIQYPEAWLGGRKGMILWAQQEEDWDKTQQQWKVASLQRTWVEPQPTPQGHDDPMSKTQST